MCIGNTQSPQSVRQSSVCIQITTNSFSRTDGTTWCLHYCHTRTGRMPRIWNAAWRCTGVEEVDWRGRSGHCLKHRSQASADANRPTDKRPSPSRLWTFQSMFHQFPFLLSCAIGLLTYTNTCSRPLTTRADLIYGNSSPIQYFNSKRISQVIILVLVTVSTAPVFVISNPFQECSHL